MKIVFVLRHVGVFRHFDAVVRKLCANGHTVNVLSVPSRKGHRIDRPLRLCQAEVADCIVELIEPVRGLRWRLLSLIREIINYAIYFQPNHPSPALANRWEIFLFPPIRFGMKMRPVKEFLVGELAQGMLKNIENFFGPDKSVTKWLKNHSPDIVIASPFVFGFSIEIEYVKAAMKLGIPTVFALASWDNLTTKGTFQVYPDHVLVWNHPLLREAVEIHNVPENRLVITGAPSFDAYFDFEYCLDYASFCQKIGIDQTRPFLLYVASSRTIAGDETPFVARLVSCLKESELAKKCQIVVRPHPLNASIWDTFSKDSVTIWPPGGEIPDTRESKQDYYDMLYHCKAVVGVNTSAFLEAAIIDKPCVTIMTDDYRHSQSGIGHFHHLLNGDFIEAASSFPEVVGILEKIIDGADAKAENRRQFVVDFLRPMGIDQPASLMMVKAIEAIILE